MATFSERNGYKKVPLAMVPESMPEGLRNKLWNLFDRVMTPDKLEKITFHLWFHLYKEPLDTRGVIVSDFRTDWRYTVAKIRERFLTSEWYVVYDHLELLIGEDILSEQLVNAILEQEQAAYRSVQGQIVQITDAVEIAAVELAANTGGRFSSSSQHIKNALTLLSDRANPDYRNSIKESISAVEAMGKTLNGSEKGTLDDALKGLKKRPLYNPALLDGFRKIYGWSSDSEDGIRHSMKKTPSLEYVEAKFFLISCSAFVNYLKAVGADGQE
ncbi:hypothetical protein FHW83_004714 [Duganella sp. SG902]|uniref:AbiJ-NTD4 domain-containing protein n=1 Tax=Duganella sp. SG902 TaxID=2587016 RepID=UPI00159E9301|nr:hypothetical protein [Duganella sp. SG902]NVM78883.1 hypothetical protein [Duganella sp. SG902]